MDYDKKSGNPKLTFLTPRASAKDLPIFWDDYYTRKKRHFAKIEAMEHYVRQDIRCRTQQIVAYFGETLHQKCGICDICIQQKREQTGKAYPEGNPEAKDLILKYLENGPVPLQTMIDCLRPLLPKEATRIIQYYLDLGLIRMKEENLFK